TVAIERAVVTQADLDALLAGQPVGRWLAVELEGPWARASLRGLPGSALVGVEPGEATAPFVMRVADVKFAGLRVPDALVDWGVHNFDPTLRLRNLPVAITVAPMGIRPGRFEIGADR